MPISTGLDPPPRSLSTAGSEGRIPGIARGVCDLLDDGTLLLLPPAFDGLATPGPLPARQSLRWVKQCHSTEIPLTDSTGNGSSVVPQHGQDPLSGVQERVGWLPDTAQDDVEHLEDESKLW